jgi:hypothetical protein
VIAPTPSEAPQRKKSVRVSLQPTFSTTPPAIYDKELTSIHNRFREKHITGARRHYGMCHEEDTYKMVNAI